MHKHQAPHHMHAKRFSNRGLTSFMIGIILVFTPFIVEHLGYTGDVLIASDNVEPPFDKSLVLIDQHGVEGAVGIVLNKPLPADQRAQLSPFIRNEKIPIGYGGPIETTERLLVLEERQPRKVGGKPVFDLEFWDDAVRMTPDLLMKIRESYENGEQHYRLFAGFTYWNPFQLESEVLVHNAWDAVHADHDIVFQNGKASRWDALEKQEKSEKRSDLNQS